MPIFATRADLLARSNARRLAQLAVPTDMAMVPEAALRDAITEQDLSEYADADRAALALALEAIDKALSDADAVILSYGIPETVQSTLLARLTSTIALYYLQGIERMTDDVQKAYDAVIAMLKAHARGELSLLPPDPDAPPLIDGDGVAIYSSRPRYGKRQATTSDDWE